MTRRAHQPDPAQRRQVEALAGYGVPETEIAGVIGIDAESLRKHYRPSSTTATPRPMPGSPRTSIERPQATAAKP